RGPSIGAARRNSGQLGKAHAEDGDGGARGDGDSPTSGWAARLSSLPADAPFLDLSAESFCDAVRRSALSKCIKCGAPLPPSGDCPSCQRSAERTQSRIPALLDKDLQFDRRRPNEAEAPPGPPPIPKRHPPGVVPNFERNLSSEADVARPAPAERPSLSPNQGLPASPTQRPSPSSNPLFPTSPSPRPSPSPTQGLPASPSARPSPSPTQGLPASPLTRPSPSPTQGLPASPSPRP